MHDAPGRLRFEINRLSATPYYSSNFIMLFIGSIHDHTICAVYASTSMACRCMQGLWRPSNIKNGRGVGQLDPPAFD
jgi:hypothetical protein